MHDWFPIAVAASFGETGGVRAARRRREETESRGSGIGSRSVRGRRHAMAAAKL